MIDKKILLAHGSGGAATGDLIKELFAEAFGYDPEQPLEDAAVVEVPGPDQGPDAARKTSSGVAPEVGHTDSGQDRQVSSARVALTTDSFVVTPVIFKGGDIGRLSVCGTVNDLLSRGAVPKYLTAGFILEEGLAYETLKTVVTSMAATAKEAGVRIVTGDTKVIEGRGGSEPGLFINTAGVGVFPERQATGEEPAIKQTAASGGAVSEPVDVPRLAGISAANARPGDKILVSGTMGDHHAAILSERLSIETPCQSDCAPLNGIVSALLEADIRIRTIRDITRGGLATVLKELAEASGRSFIIEDDKVPVAPEVQDFCGLTGLDPLYMGNEGKLVVIVDPSDAERAVEIMRACRYGENAAMIGEVGSPDEAGYTGGLSLRPGDLILKTPLGGLRSLTVLQGEGLPRIC